MLNLMLARARRCAVPLLLLAISAGLPARAFAQDSGELERRLYGNDAVAAATAAHEFVKSAARAEPIDIIAASIQFYRAGEYDLASFWFYAGYLRASYAYEIIKSEKAALIGGFMLARQPDIDAKAMLDVVKDGCDAGSGYDLGGIDAR